MTTHITKTRFDGKNIVTQEIPVGEVYKREWVGLTAEDRWEILFSATEQDERVTVMQLVEAKLKEKNI